MRVSSRCVLIENDKVLLIYREKNDRIYYVFPGGGVEDGETNEECLIRECREELGIKINIIKQLYEVKGKDFLQHFFLIERISGKIGSGDANEYEEERNIEMNKGNVLVIGNSGVGKSTLINAVLGEQVAKTSWGTEGTTKELKIYEKERVPFRIIDTAGFEPSILKEMQAINAVKRWSRESTKEGKEDTAINIIWFCYKE